MTGPRGRAKAAVHRCTIEKLLRIFENSQENTHSEVHSKSFF